MIEIKNSFAQLDSLCRLTIRRFEPSDLRRVYEIECRSFKDPYHVLFLLNLYELYPSTFFVAEVNGVVAGYIISRIISNTEALVPKERWHERHSCVRSFIPKVVRKTHGLACARANASARDKRSCLRNSVASAGDSRSCYRNGHILAIAVDPIYRKRGIGRVLTEVTLKEFEKLNVEGVWLEVKISNASAIRLYRSMGFKEKGIVNRYYADGESAVILKKEF